MEIILTVICIVLLIFVILELYSSKQKQAKLHEKLIQTQAENTTLNGQFESIMNSLSHAQTSLGHSGAKIDQLVSDMHDINIVMTNTKKRGTFGEYQLDHLLSLYCGHNNHVYESQYHLKNGKIGDAALHLPGTYKVLIIDSKFPMENYLNIVDYPDSSSFKNEFKKNVKN